MTVKVSCLVLALLLVLVSNAVLLFLLVLVASGVHLFPSMILCQQARPSSLTESSELAVQILHGLTRQQDSDRRMFGNARHQNEMDRQSSSEKVASEPSTWLGSGQNDKDPANLVSRSARLLYAIRRLAPIKLLDSFRADLGGTAEQYDFLDKASSTGDISEKTSTSLNSYLKTFQNDITSQNIILGLARGEVTFQQENKRRYGQSSQKIRNLLSLWQNVLNSTASHNLHAQQTADRFFTLRQNASGVYAVTSSGTQTSGYSRHKRRSDTPPPTDDDNSSNNSNAVTDNNIPPHPLYDMPKTFSSFTDQELGVLGASVTDHLLPALVKFEDNVVKHLIQLHKQIISQDLRVEKLEHVLMTLTHKFAQEPQSDAEDNKSELTDPGHKLDVQSEGYLPSGNSSWIDLLGEGSGELEWIAASTTTLSPTTTTSTTTESTTANMLGYYDLHRAITSVEQKVLALENYNVMSDSELTRVRSETVKMDDKVTEMERRLRNLQIRTSAHTHKLTDMEIYMSRSELSIHTALDSYARMNARVEAYKDRLTEFKSKLHAVSAQGARHDQIANELRAADSYKAHDLQEMRKTVYGVEGRLNQLYHALDHNLDILRTDVRAMMDRMCSINKLAC